MDPEPDPEPDVEAPVAGVVLLNGPEADGEDDLDWDFLESVFLVVLSLAGGPVRFLLVSYHRTSRMVWHRECMERFRKRTAS
jgi:hypothetical protein